MPRLSCGTRVQATSNTCLIKSLRRWSEGECEKPNPLASRDKQILIESVAEKDGCMNIDYIMAAVQDEIWVVSLILFYEFYLSLAYHGFLGCFRGSFTHFICFLPIDPVSQLLSCQLYVLYPSLACTEFSVTFQRPSHSPCALSCVSLLCQTVLYA